MHYYLFFIWIFLFIIIYTQHRNEGVRLIQQIKKNKEQRGEMLELAKRFIDKECIIYTFNSQIEGVIKEVADGAILLEKDGVPEAINVDYVVRVREYPKNKKGKKKSLVLD